MKFAIVIGCSTYSDPEIGNLNFANLDAANFAGMLNESFGLEQKNIRLLDSQAALERKSTRSNVIRELLAPAKRSSIDLLVIFFSGHGIHSATDGRDYILLEDTQWRAIEETALSFEYVKSLALRWSAKCTLFFFDACRNFFRGSKSLNGEDDEPFHPDELKFPGSAAFFSCARSERSYEVPELQSGLFSHSLIEAFGEVGRCRTVRDVNSYIRKRVPILGAQYQRPTQTPYSIIEPLEISSVILVSVERSERFDETKIIGDEIRLSKTRRIETPVHKNGILAVDFGSSYSLAAFTGNDGSIQYLHNSEGKRTLASVISFRPNFNYVVGQDSASSNNFGEYVQVVRDFKRLLTLNSQIDVFGHPISAVTLASLILKSIRTNYEEATGELVRDAIAAVPVNFGIGATNTLAHAFHIAGLPLTRIIGEPCAAAMNLLGRDDLLPNDSSEKSFVSDLASVESACERAKETDSSFIALVVDVGGGTTDLSFVEVAWVDDTDTWIAQVLSTLGDNHLGGIDYDKCLVDLIRQRSRAEFGEDYVQRQLGRDEDLIGMAEAIKKQFGCSAKVYVPLPAIETRGGLQDVGMTLERSEFYEASKNLSERLKESLARLSREWARNVDFYPKKDPDYVVLAGQGSKIYPVRKIINEFSKQIPVIDFYQENAVILGLFKQSEVLADLRKDVLLFDAIYTGLSMACKEITSSVIYVDTSGQASSGVGISATYTENSESVVLLSPFETFPTLYHTRLCFTSKVINAMPLPIYETFENGDQVVLLGSLVIPPGTEGLLELYCDVDVNGVISIQIYKIVEPDRRENFHKCILAYIVNRQWTSVIPELLKLGFEPLPTGYANLEALNS